MGNFIKEKMGAHTNILEKIKEIRDYFQSIQKYGDVADENIEEINVKEIVNILSNIINDNNNEKEFKTIGEKISKFNFEKYIKCNEDLDLLMKIYKHIEKEKGPGPIPIENKNKIYFGDILVDINIYKLQEIHREVKHRIKIFNNNKKN